MKSQNFLNQGNGIEWETQVSNRRRSRSVEQIYDDICYIKKEHAGLPNRYYMLTSEQELFLELFAESLDKPPRDDVLYARDAVVEALESLETLLKEV